MSALHELTIKAIRRAQKQGGIVDPVEDWAAIAELDRLARAATETPAHDKLIFCDLPINVGDIQLYRLSWAAMDWIAFCASDWFGDDGAMYDKALAWAHAHSRKPDIFRACPDKRSAQKAIIRWTWSFWAPWVSVMAAVDQLLEELPRKKADQTGSGTTTAGFLDVLIETHGGTIDYWMWDVSVPAMLSLTAAIQNRNDGNEGNRRTASGKAPDPESSIVKKTVELQRAARKFIQRIVTRSADRVEHVPAKQNGMEKTAQVNGHSSAESICAIRENCPEEPNRT